MLQKKVTEKATGKVVSHGATESDSLTIPGGKLKRAW
jgi:hypothetical protein